MSSLAITMVMSSIVITIVTPSSQHATPRDTPKVQPESHLQLLLLLLLVDGEGQQLHLGPLVLLLKTEDVYIDDDADSEDSGPM